MVRDIRYASLKLMLRFGTPFRNAFAVRLRRKPEGFFQKSEGFFRESESFSEERWVRTRVSFRNAVQLRLRIFRVRV